MGDLNHDWLVHFCNAMDIIVQSLGETPPDLDTVRMNLDDKFTSWAGKRPKLGELIDGLESSRSPSRFFERVPLSRMASDQKEWLRELTCRLWSHKYGVEERIAKLKEQLKAADKAYEQIIPCLPLDPNDTKIAVLRKAFTSFAGHCRKVHDGISRFRNEVRSL